MDYFQLQEAVFNHLWTKHQNDKSFTFSVRQVASKGAERNHFIGTAKSKYFGFTCWDIPVYYPGSSSDLTDFIFKITDNRCNFKFQYIMAKSASGTQSEGDLALGRLLMERLPAAGLNLWLNDEANKMLYFHIDPNPPGYTDVGNLLKAFDDLYAQIAPVMDECIEKIKSERPGWTGGRFAKERFDSLIEKMHTRISRFATASPQILKQLPSDEDEIATEEFTHSLNTILYGPPGTGKTYNTVNKALAIAIPGYEFQGKTRVQLKQDYDRLVKEGQIEFVTFHQSMSYEDFIEGIKPVKPKENDPFLKYDVQDGIFKLLVQRATFVPDVKTASIHIAEDEFKRAAFYSLNLNTDQPEDKVIFRYCLDNGCIALNVAEGIDVTGKSETDIKSALRQDGVSTNEISSLNKFVHHLKINDYIILSDGPNICRAIGKVTSGYSFNPNESITPDHFRNVQWIAPDVQIPREELYESPFASGIERLDKEEIKKEFFTKKTVSIQPALERKNYVLIIDEINRGNVSQIFGELITLIEEDKRVGRAEALTITLPYSKKPFSVPDNLYIIGTMNTADRSVEALDTALRRRFMFQEMQPKPELLSPKEMLRRFWNKPEYVNVEYDDWVQEPYLSASTPLYELIGFDRTKEEKIHDVDSERLEWLEEDMNIFTTEDFMGINLELMLLAINERLTVLLSKDHLIGHAWLMSVNSITDLRVAFKEKLLPLLQEYFYNNYSKIGLVLGSKFFQQPIKVSKGTFAKFDNGADIIEELSDKVVYRLKEIEEITVEDFISIYS